MMARVLFIEDDDGSIHAMRTVFARTRDDAELDVAGTMAEGIAKAAGADVIILDLTLPDSTMDESLARISALRLFAPVLVLTGSHLAGRAADLAERALRSGADAVIFKPWQISELMGAILAARINPRRPIE